MAVAGSADKAGPSEQTDELRLRDRVAQTALSTGDEFAIEGGVVTTPMTQGGDFILDGEIVTQPSARGGAFELHSSQEIPAGADSCFCGPLFADGFESGDISAWSTSSP